MLSSSLQCLLSLAARCNYQVASAGIHYYSEFADERCFPVIYGKHPGLGEVGKAVESSVCRVDFSRTLSAGGVEQKPSLLFPQNKRGQKRSGLRA